MPQLMQLNRASQQELREIQPPPKDPVTSRPTTLDSGTEQLNRQQNVEQGALQESQRRDLLLQRQRARSVNEPASSHRVDAIGRQRQYRLQQQNQLNRHRIQQGGRTR